MSNRYKHITAEQTSHSSLSVISLPVWLYLSVSPTAGRQEQQSHSWKHKDASHLSRPAGHRQESAPASTHRKDTVFDQSKSKLLSIAFCCQTHLGSSLWTLCSWRVPPGFYTCWTAAVSPNMDYLCVLRNLKNQLNSHYQSQNVQTHVNGNSSIAVKVGKKTPVLFTIILYNTVTAATGPNC